jgi:hypothetical protein
MDCFYAIRALAGAPPGFKCVPVSERDNVIGLLRNLYLMVKGECPSLLNEDSGGDAALDIAISDLLAESGK